MTSVRWSELNVFRISVSFLTSPTLTDAVQLSCHMTLVIISVNQPGVYRWRHEHVHVKEVFVQPLISLPAAEQFIMNSSHNTGQIHTTLKQSWDEEHTSAHTRVTAGKKTQTRQAANILTVMDHKTQIFKRHRSTHQKAPVWRTFDDLCVTFQTLSASLQRFENWNHCQGCNNLLNNNLMWLTLQYKNNRFSFRGIWYDSIHD